jgi:hypothetical protein
MQYWNIWMEGFADNGNWCHARLEASGIEAETFDEAVKKYIKENPDCGISEISRDCFPTEEDSNWEIYGCSLYPTEEQAKKSFG